MLRQDKNTKQCVIINKPIKEDNNYWFGAKEMVSTIGFSDIPVVFHCTKTVKPWLV